MGRGKAGAAVRPRTAVCTIETSLDDTHANRPPLGDRHVHRFAPYAFAIAAAAACRPAAPPSESARIVLEREPCFGFCPTYRVSLEPDGAVRFVGLNPQRPRSDSARVSPEAVRLLAHRFEEAGFFAMDSAYVPGERGCGINATDHAYVNLTAALAGRTKTVRHYLGCTGTENADSIPAARANREGALGKLERLAAEVDSAAGTSRWLDSTTTR